MTNPALTWISEAHQGGYLRAAFIDCQRGEYKCLENKTPFTIAQNLARELRAMQIPISHFLFDQSKPESLQPFLYKGAQHHRFPNRDMDFKSVIPTSNEWVYPKEEFDGFTNPHSAAILSTSDILQRSTLICAGFNARACLMETALGSFAKAANPDKHQVIIALGATNLHPDYYQEYITDFLAQADADIRDRIGFATVEQIIAAAQTQSSQPHTYRA